MVGASAQTFIVINVQHFRFPVKNTVLFVMRAEAYKVGIGVLMQSFLDLTCSFYDPYQHKVSSLS